MTYHLLSPAPFYKHNFDHIQTNQRLKKKQHEISSSFSGSVLQTQPRTVATLKLFPAHFQGENSLLTVASKKNHNMEIKRHMEKILFLRHEQCSGLDAKAVLQ